MIRRFLARLRRPSTVQLLTMPQAEFEAYLRSRGIGPGSTADPADEVQPPDPRTLGATLSTTYLLVDVHGGATIEEGPWIRVARAIGFELELQGAGLDLVILQVDGERAVAYWRLQAGAAA